MKRGVFWCVLLCASTALWAYSYHDTLLKIYAKVLPKIVVTNQPGEIPISQIDLCIVYEPGDDDNARELQRMIADFYPDGIKGIGVVTRLCTFDDLAPCRDASALMLMQSTNERIAAATAFAKTHHIFSAAYDALHLQQDVIFSLDIQSDVKPYINVNAAKQSRVPLNSALLQISKIYHPDLQP